jgi:hypothetical protein
MDTNVPEVPGLSTLLVHWSTGTDATAQTVEVTFPLDVPLDKIDLTGQGKEFKAELKTVTAGQHYQVVVTPAADMKLFHQVTIKVTLHLKDGTTRARSFMAMVS